MSTDLSSRLRDALVQLVPGQPEAIASLRELYDDGMVFRDPIQVVRGIDAFLAMNRRLLGRMKRLEWQVHLAHGDATRAVLEWSMRGATKLGVPVKVDGMTRAIARDGRIVDHRDYWDLGELAASPIPGGQRILHALLSPFA